MRPTKLEETAYWIDQLVPGELNFRRVDERHIALGEVAPGQQLGCTVDFGNVDTGLATADRSRDVRSELLTVTRASPDEVTAVLAAAAQLLADARGILPAQPGTMLPGLVERAGLTDLSVTHGLFIAPYLWGGETPQMDEPTRLTVLLQLVLLTPDEHVFAVEHGVGRLQEELGRRQVDLLDWRR